MHGYAPFFPFHRQFVRDWEVTLQRIANDSSIYQPYWDWTIDLGNPQASPIFNPDWLGGNSYGNCTTIPLLDGIQWRFWKPPYNVERHCLARNFDRGLMNAYYSRAALLTMFAESASYPEFHTAIEGGPNNIVHASIGGDMANWASCVRSTTEQSVFLFQV